MISSKIGAKTPKNHLYKNIKHDKMNAIYQKRSCTLDEKSYNLSAQHSTAVKTGLFSRLLDYNLTQKDICTYSIRGADTNVLFRYNECMNHIGGDAYG